MDVPRRPLVAHVQGMSPTAGGSDTTVAKMIIVTQGFMVPVASVTGPLLGALGRKSVLGFGFVSLVVTCSPASSCRALARSSACRRSGALAQASWRSHSSSSAPT